MEGCIGKWYLTMFVEKGRVEDNQHRPFKPGLREVASVDKKFRLTANQHCNLSDVAVEDLPEMKPLLAKWKPSKIGCTGLRPSSSACVLCPAWGLATVDSDDACRCLLARWRESAIRMSSETARVLCGRLAGPA
jgi:sulfite reductase (NADPH) hemoprotein beta-component